MATVDASEVLLTPADIARKLQLDPSAPIRWCRKGVSLAGGVRLILQHVCTPGGYRVKPEWLDSFLERIADDRAGRPKVERKAPIKSARVQKMRSDLAAAGF